MKTAVKSPAPTDYRRGLGFFLTETPPTGAPKHLFRPLFPRNPHFPASGPTQGLFQGPPAESKILTLRWHKEVGALMPSPRTKPANPNPKPENE
jgi:hypothetical protein